MEQLQAPRAVDADDAAVPSLPSVEIHPGLLPDLAARAREQPGEEGAEAQRFVEKLLGALQPAPRDGELLLGMLEAGSFSGLTGEDGTPTRALAIEALLRLGYPWSIQVHPDDLAWYRAHQQGRSRLRVMILLGILAAELVAAGALWLFT